MGKTIIKKQHAIDSLPDFKYKDGDSGLYGITPFANLDKHGKTMFKVGLGVDLKKRLDEYHTYFPMGYWYKDLLANPDEEKENFWYKDPEDRNKRKFGKRAYLNEIERFLHSDIVEEGGKQLYTTTRVKKARVKNGVIYGSSEWFYAAPRQIELAFDKAHTIYGGQHYKVPLDDLDAAGNKEKKTATYTGEVNFKIH